MIRACCDAHEVCTLRTAWHVLTLCSLSLSLAFTRLSPPHATAGCRQEVAFANMKGDMARRVAYGVTADNATAGKATQLQSIVGLYRDTCDEATRAFQRLCLDDVMSSSLRCSAIGDNRGRFGRDAAISCTRGNRSRLPKCSGRYVGSLVN
ncbi:uncharacterized protein B0I36DRAFT_311754 [Microdochium trichocladiopsis]|uniref:Secreted protein n=1 Tax=Microdochium trichocladiopsis TaxID=1682393 RepID=A0A9P9BUF0_9PEZI|nr:uncharacterized protein B0I36DRAFT_311754 [Microdochium trichocladiopsis]KAH7040916.1 hypothetical protein B0I36DRAFT_311754 [Microdochium trichocladiopsis]